MKTRSWSALLIAFLLPFSSSAEDADIIATQWFDHFTFGATNTVVGLIYGGAGMAYNAIFDPKVEAFGFRLDDSKQQIVMKGSGYSWFYEQNSGLFHFSKDQGGFDEHEAGHGKMSGIFGPLHHLIQGVDYLIEGYGDHDWAESLAEANVNLGPTLKNSRPLELKLEYIDRNGKKLSRLATNFTFLERASKVPLTSIEDDPKSLNQQTLRNRYLTLGFGVNRTIAQNCEDCHKTGITLDASLFNREFQTQWRALTDGLRILLDSKEDAGKLSVDVRHKRTDLTALSQKVSLGAEVEPVKGLVFQVAGQAGYSLKGIWSKHHTQNPGAIANNEVSPGFMLTGGLGAWANVRLKDFGEAYGEFYKERGTGGYDSDTKTVGARTPILFKMTTFSSLEGKEDCNESQYDCPNSIGSPVGLYGGVSHSRTTEKGQNADGVPGTLKVQTTLFHVGGRF